MKNANGPNSDVRAANKVLDFQFCKPFSEISGYLESLGKRCLPADVWFYGKINTGTGNVISSGFGRIRPQPPKVETESIEDYDDDECEEVAVGDST